MTAPGSLGLAAVGSFTTQKRRARGRGIDVYRTHGSADPSRWSLNQHLDGLENPSFLVGDATRSILYCVHGDGEVASAFAVDPASGHLQALGSAPTGGTNVVHQALDPSGRFLVVANYGSGSVAVLPVRADGGLEPAVQVLDLPGKVGPHRAEQACAHPHQIVFDPSGAFVLVPDKGLDRVFVLAFDGGRGRLEIAGEVVTRPGAGPRHLVFHPHQPLVLLLNEIDSTLAVLRWNAGTLTPVHLVTTLPPDFFGASTAAAIAITPCGQFVFATNRGQDGIAGFRMDESGEQLVPLGWTPSGRDPRFATLDPAGTHLVVANERGDNLIAFAVDAENGSLAKVGERESASPCTVAFL